MFGCRRKRFWPSLIAVAMLFAVMRYTLHHYQDLGDVMSHKHVHRFSSNGLLSSSSLGRRQSLTHRDTSLIGASVISRSNTSWSRDGSACIGDTNFVKTVLHSPAGDTPIYVHPASEDIWVSATIIKGEVWEGDLVTKFYNFFKQDDDLVLVDIGGNIGVYGLTIAKMGRKAVLVEPLLKNVKKLCHSIRDGNYTNAYIVHNAVSNTRVKVALGSSARNVGGTYVKPVTSDSEETAQTILLDDLLEVFQFYKVAMKMDVEGHEDEVLLGAETFFSKVDVRYVLMEWNTHQNKPEAKNIIEFLTKHNMVPVHPIKEHMLPLNRSEDWPGDVIWKKGI
ncbi:uncharacterized protein LOC124263561 [Haliotis rubra]|uniref:uncharacterized protein LOC124263561 n=1 Tax=Haliotis rubra TaxID=36100 RepID=UPI001EE60C10|nr:uncharacterized protein LOC124263561 [Haliotis rubra]